MTIIADQQKFDVGDVIELFDLDLTPILGTSTVFYFTPTIYASNEYIKWRGNTYEAVDVQATGFERNVTGALPRPKLSLSGAVLANSFVMNSINTVLIANSNLIGAKVIRWRTLKTYIDNVSTTDVSMYIQVDVYVINQKTVHNKYNIEWELTPYMDYTGQKLPRRQMLKDFCTHVYRRWETTTLWEASKTYSVGDWVIPITENSYRYCCTVAGTSYSSQPTWPTTVGNTVTESGSTLTWMCYSGFVYNPEGKGSTCPYVGTSYFKENGSSTALASEDVCGKSNADCILRYPVATGAALPTTAFPLISATRVR